MSTIYSVIVLVYFLKKYLNMTLFLIGDSKRIGTGVGFFFQFFARFGFNDFPLFFLTAIKDQSNKH